MCIRDSSKTKHIKGKDLRWIRKIKYLATIDSIVVYTYTGKAYKKTYSSEARHLIGIPPSILEKIKIEQMPVSQISLIGSKSRSICPPRSSRFSRLRV